MQLKAFLTFGLIGSAIANAIPSVDRRDLPTITGALGKVSDAITALDTAVTGFSGDAASLDSATTALNDAITSGTQAVSSTDAVTAEQALEIQTAVQGIITKTQGVTSDLVAKKDAIASAGQTATVLKGLQDQKASSEALSQAVSSKVPADLQEVAQQLSGQITAPIDQAIAAFS